MDLLFVLFNACLYVTSVLIQIGFLYGGYFIGEPFVKNSSYLAFNYAEFLMIRNLGKRYYPN